VCETLFGRRGGCGDRRGAGGPGGTAARGADGVRCRHRGGRAELAPRLRGAQGSGHLHPDVAEALQRVARDLHRPPAQRGGAGGEVEESAVSVRVCVCAGGAPAIPAASPAGQTPLTGKSPQ